MEGNSLSRRQAASENEYFLKAQEESALLHRTRLLRTDPKRLAAATAPLVQTFASSSMLPQIAKHSTRLQAPPQAELRKSVVRGPVKDRLRPVPGGLQDNPMYVGNLKLGTRLSLGRGKWQASSGTVEGTSLFDVKAAYKLIDGTDATLPRQRIVAPAPETVITVGNKLFRVFPELTPGRALVWGTLLAVWGTSAMVVRTARRLEIRSIDDVRSALNDALTPMAGRIQDQVDPYREVLIAGDKSFMQSDLSKQLKLKLAK